MTALGRCGRLPLVPLVKGYGRASVGKNIEAEIAAGKPRAQAVAIGLDVARRAAKKAGKKVKGLKPKPER